VQRVRRIAARSHAPAESPAYGCHSYILPADSSSRSASLTLKSLFFPAACQPCLPAESPFCRAPLPGTRGGGAPAGYAPAIRAPGGEREVVWPARRRMVSKRPQERKASAREAPRCRRQFSFLLAPIFPCHRRRAMIVRTDYAARKHRRNALGATSRGCRRCAEPSGARRARGQPCVRCGVQARTI